MTARPNSAIARCGIRATGDLDSLRVWTRAGHDAMVAEVTRTTEVNSAFT
jgi:hypothetical protein